MTIATEITRIKTNISNTYAEAKKMGAQLPLEQNSNNLAACIKKIPQGGGGEGAPSQHTIKFFDADGKVLRKDIVPAGSKYEIPTDIPTPNYDPTYLEFSQWTHSKTEEAYYSGLDDSSRFRDVTEKYNKVFDKVEKNVYIGAVYRIKNKDAAHIFVSVSNDLESFVQYRISIDEYYFDKIDVGLKIDWGDGTKEEFTNEQIVASLVTDDYGNKFAKVYHRYLEKGDYVQTFQKTLNGTLSAVDIVENNELKKDGSKLGLYEYAECLYISIASAPGVTKIYFSSILSVQGADSVVGLPKLSVFVQCSPFIPSYSLDYHIIQFSPVSYVCFNYQSAFYNIVGQTGSVYLKEYAVRLGYDTGAPSTVLNMGSLEVFHTDAYMNINECYLQKVSNCPKLREIEIPDSAYKNPALLWKPSSYLTLQNAPLLELPKIKDLYKHITFDKVENSCVEGPITIGRAANMSVSRCSRLKEIIVDADKVQHFPDIENNPMLEKVTVKCDKSFVNSTMYFSAAGSSSPLFKTLDLSNTSITNFKYASRPFEGTHISKIIFPNSLTTKEIKDSDLFYGSKALGTFDLSFLDGWTINLDSIFRSSDLSYVIFPKNFTPTGHCVSSGSSYNGAFSYCHNLLELTIPPQITTLNGCFADNCSSLRKVWLPSTVTSILVDYNRPFESSKEVEIYTDAASKLPGWSDKWNYLDSSGNKKAPVHYGSTYEQYLQA